MSLSRNIDTRESDARRRRAIERSVRRAFSGNGKVTSFNGKIALSTGTSAAERKEQEDFWANY